MFSFTCEIIPALRLQTCEKTISKSKHSVSMIQVDSLLVLARFKKLNNKNGMLGNINNVIMENPNYQTLSHAVSSMISRRLYNIYIQSVQFLSESEQTDLYMHRLVHWSIYQSCEAEHRWIVGKPKCCANHVCLCFCLCLCLENRK